MLKGVIVKGIGGFYYIDTERGVFETRARGIFRKEGIRPTVGDHVRISILDEENKKGSLDEILERRNELIRPRVSNVDQAVIVFAAKSPNMNLDLLDRFLLLAEEQELEIVIVINKIDKDKKKEYEEVANIYRQTGYPVICTSAEEGIGMEALQQVLENKISVFAGPSGVGKSSLINATYPGLELNTGEISEKIQRGRHTTRHAELIRISGNSYIVDSPGFTSLFLNHIPSEKLQYYFKEFEPFVHECYYNGCVHINEPDCAVKAEIGRVIDPMRYERYVTIFQNLKDEEERKK
ncbi:ribosome small subunit-dependent GTPase A [Anaerotignum sp. MB30-C6]|uniref:ribosome small subunit-dependent GTPase A n=1 Tax=Anaerotignum sp. MB30-C6 TaxID=3070814 RepID=UPI0027DE5305|nr:ribosome small subunit-dependent GTPase A [Anaerotignum sp. MB30-C6]WMI80423.1 ribosome small subunit-dependent GTPase A [Anaerotignum sp. MB30-C6]